MKNLILSFKNGKFYGKITEISKERNFRKNLIDFLSHTKRK